LKQVSSCFSSEDRGLNFHLPDNLDLSKSFAQLSLPGQLQLQAVVASATTASSAGGGGDCGGHHGLHVLVRAETGVAARTQFGPLQGEPILERDVPEDFQMKDLWQIFAEDGRDGIHQFLA
jgi:hypothetical protein